jgi:hypothetical protein
LFENQELSILFPVESTSLLSELKLDILYHHSSEGVNFYLSDTDLEMHLLHLLGEFLSKNEKSNLFGYLSYFIRKHIIPSCNLEAWAIWLKIPFPEIPSDIIESSKGKSAKMSGAIVHALNQFKSENSIIEYYKSSTRKWHLEYDIAKRFIHVIFS